MGECFVSCSRIKAHSCLRSCEFDIVVAFFFFFFEILSIVCEWIREKCWAIFQYTLLNVISRRNLNTHIRWTIVDVEYFPHMWITLSQRFSGKATTVTREYANSHRNNTISYLGEQNKKKRGEIVVWSLSAHPLDLNVWLLVLAWTC